jgi:phosphate transport system substrate-binding protein
MKWFRLTLPIALWCLCASTFAADTVRLSGAAAMSTAITKKQADIEKAGGVQLAVTSKNAGKGLQDLFAGQNDVALVTGSVEKAAAGANAEKAGSVLLGEIKSYTVGKEPVLFVVHPSNPVASLTAEQLKSILTGKITNWKDVGGNDGAIEVFTLGSRNGPRIAVDEQLLQGAEMVKTAVLREAPPHICPIVSQKANAIGYMGESNLGTGVKTLKTDKEISMGYYLVTRGEPKPEQLKVIESVKKAFN